MCFFKSFFLDKELHDILGARTLTDFVQNLGLGQILAFGPRSNTGIWASLTYWHLQQGAANFQQSDFSQILKYPLFMMRPSTMLLLTPVQMTHRPVSENESLNCIACFLIYLTLFTSAPLVRVNMPEHGNQTMVNILRKYISSNGQDWNVKLP